MRALSVYDPEIRIPHQSLPYGDQDIRFMKKVILFLTLVTAVCSQAAPTVSLDSCRNMAVRNNKTIRMAEENLRSAGYYKDAARAAYLPGIDFTEIGRAHV